jgi:hypothetical protein
MPRGRPRLSATRAAARRSRPEAPVRGVKRVRPAEPEPTCDVLLLSARPTAHLGLIHQLRARGAVVRTPRHPERALGLVRRNPRFVLVDLVHGAGLNRRMVLALNGMRAPRVVIALHDGTLGPCCDEASDLTVEGFCHAAARGTLVSAIADPPGASSVMPH